MCLAVPALVIAVEAGEMARVSVDGVIKSVSLALVDDVDAGDYVLLHVGYALHKISPDEAEETLRMMADMGDAGDTGDMGDTADMRP